jgi:hypothetical protein
MYRSFPSYSMVKEYFDHLLQAKVLSYIKKPRPMTQTEKEIESLELYKKMNALAFPLNMKLRQPPRG